MTLTIPRPKRVSTTQARDQLSHLISHVQHPDAYIVLTRHERPEAALVSMDMLKRIWSQEDIDAIIDGKREPGFFR
ncbi:type II toxin-antitoxin system prevent-host-death family antitoxin [Shimia ponticola]|uniref:type II toxin-antitoxin system prevent-host-death family antitoxin n=1 Tax=Shimia ponticola TaxID=2582893 RepID=UPI00164A6D21|nr:type II toxin-antitoxin system prevent-host-death family antitoxin [Shimia ponticola]